MRDPDDFDMFYTNSIRRVTVYLHAVTGSRTEAEDAAQEAYARAWEVWHKVSRYGDPEGWVRKVGYRISVSAWRRAVARSSAHRKHGLPDDAPDLSPDYVTIIAALRQISPGQRQAIVLHHLLGLSVEEISREAGVPAGTVKARLSRGRTALAALLGDGAAGLGNNEEVPSNA